MPGGIRIFVRGWPEFVTMTQQLPEGYGQIIREFFKKSVRKIRGKVWGFTPVRTGFLRARWRQRIDGQPTPRFGTVFNNVFYARPLEFSNMRPRRRGRIPFLRPARALSVGAIRGFAKQAMVKLGELWETGNAR